MSAGPQMASPELEVPPPLAREGERALAVAVGTPVEEIRLREVAGGIKLELAPARSLRLDAEGRWITARIGPWMLRRRVDGGIVFARSDASLTGQTGGDIVARDAPPDSSWHRVVATLAASLRARLRHAAPEAIEEPPGVPAEGRTRRLARADALLARAEALGPPEFLALSREFDRVYAEPVPILPPDRYRDLVVLPATGCPHADCTFCAWYQDATFRAFDGPTLETHLDRLEAFFGEGLRARDGLFLGSASAFSVSDERLLLLLERVEARFGAFPRGAAGFLDPHHAPGRDEAAWRSLRQAGVALVVVGLETAHAPLRERLGKPGDLSELGRNVQALRQAGIAAGITVLTGASRPEEEEAHRRETVAYLASLGLTRRDRVYLSPWDRAPDPAAALREAEAIGRALGQVSPVTRSTYALNRYRFYA
ncbi:MAG: hypothetical protein P1V51_06820 [Deltaproteobacteria bacterium]|nr:hypothetical protein [Deltaproteobacteria bacterium]